MYGRGKFSTAEREARGANCFPYPFLLQPQLIDNYSRLPINFVTWKS